MKVYCLLEAHCGDPYELMRVFSTEENAKAAVAELLEDEDNSIWNTYYIREMEVL